MQVLPVKIEGATKTFTAALDDGSVYVEKTNTDFPDKQALVDFATEFTARATIQNTAPSYADPTTGNAVAKKTAEDQLTAAIDAAVAKDIADAEAAQLADAQLEVDVKP